MNVLIIRTAATVVDPSDYNLQEIGLARALTRKGHKCGIVYYTDKDPHRDLIDTGSGQIVLHWLRGRAVAGDALFPGLDELLKNYDVVQVAEYDRLQSVQLYAHRHNVVVYHGPYRMPLEITNGTLHRAKSFLFDSVYSRRSRNAGVHVLAKSDLATELLKQKGFGLASTVGVGLDPELFTKRVEAHITTSRYNLLSIGRFDRNKNTLFLLEVFEQIIRRLENVHLFLIGTGSDTYAGQVLKRIEEPCFDDKLTYIPRVSQSEIGAYYEASDLFLLPSIYEIFGMVLLEAGWFGCPCVTSKNGGSLTLSKGCDIGSVLENFDSEVWADAICELLLDEDRRSLISVKLGQHVRENWTWDALADRFIEEYESVLDEE